MTHTKQICSLLRERSTEHTKAVHLMYDNGLYGQVISILRQELDSLVRTVFLLSNTDLMVRDHYIGQTLSNSKWTYPGTKSVITDKNMVDIANNLFGWTKSVYKLGCAFIHLSPMSDYNNENPFLRLSTDEISDIKQHLNNYHGFPMSYDLTMDTVCPYLIMVFEKVSGNLGCYIEDLEMNKKLI